MAWYRIKADIYYDDDPTRVEYFITEASSMADAVRSVEMNLDDHLEGVTVEWIDESGPLLIDKQTYDLAGMGFPGIVE